MTWIFRDDSTHPVFSCTVPVVEGRMSRKGGIQHIHYQGTALNKITEYNIISMQFVVYLLSKIADNLMNTMFLSRREM